MSNFGTTIGAIIAIIFCNVVKTSTSSAKSCYGPDYIQKFPFTAITDDVCIHAYYNSSETNSLNITLSYGNTVYGKETISDQDPAFKEKTICDPEFPSPFGAQGQCDLCLGFDDIFLSDEWAKICPKFILRCHAPVAFSGLYHMDCFNVGDDDKDDINKIIGGNTDFVFKLLSSNALTKDIVTDLFVSPFSISNALIMTMMAADGDTLKQIMNAFELTVDDYDIFDSYDTLIQSLQHKTHSLTNIVDNRLWINSLWYKVISPSYLKDFDRFGEIIKCNFKNHSYIETMKIDNYAESTTHNLIKHPLANKNLSTSTVMLLTNLMYLKANWQTPFTQNISQTFTDDNDEKIEIEMMMTDKNKQFNIYNDSDVEVIELPLVDNFSDISFIMIRPTKEKYLNEGPVSTIEFEKSLNRTLLKKWLNGMKEITYGQPIKLPFLEMYNMEDVTDALRKLGIVDLFDPKKADLKNLTIPHYQVYETNVNRQDYLKITPNGIEIASFVTDGDDGKDDTNQGPVKHADLPFLFLIMDRSVDLILYSGRVTNPKGWHIYIDDNGGSSHHNFGIIVLSLFLVGTVTYCLIKYLYNRTVMQLTGIESIPHIQQCRACKNFANQKLNTIYQTDGSNDNPLSPPEKYAQLMNDDNMML